jgi:hypothetical protein
VFWRRFGTTDLLIAKMRDFVQVREEIEWMRRDSKSIFRRWRAGALVEYSSLTMTLTTEDAPDLVSVAGLLKSEAPQQIGRRFTAAATISR